MVAARRRHVGGMRGGAYHLILLCCCDKGRGGGQGRVGGFLTLLGVEWLVLVLERVFWNGGHWLCEDSRLA